MRDFHHSPDISGSARLPSRTWQHQVLSQSELVLFFHPNLDTKAGSVRTAGSDVAL